ncbi:MAG: LVIVD repeat-containing protein, partial [Adhaeribacter sp.]
PIGRTRPFIAFLLLVLASLAGCTDECETTITYTVQEPIQMSRSAMVASVASLPGRPLASTGKIYSKDHLVFINEPFKGIHVIDNSQPAAPKTLAFINIPGNVDMSIRDNTLYADAGPDLLALDISDPMQVSVKKHVYNIFRLAYDSNTGTFLPMGGNLSDQITLGFTTRVVTQTQECNTNPGNGRGVFPDFGGVIFENSFSSNKSAAAPGGSTGTGGSMARFTIAGNHLYALNSNNLRVFDISSPTNPQPGTLVHIGGGMETVFPYGNKLFIGSMTGMLIYDISNGAAPTRLGGYSHARVCDPVVVSGNYAYVTLRTNGNARCGINNTNQLDVVDISNPQSPQLKKTFPMQSPYGLGIDQNTLFVCEGEFGLKVFDATDPLTVGDKQLGHFRNLNMYDVIPLGNTLLAIGSDGLYQYDYSNPKDIRFLSKIPVAKP